jgi:uncharacterized alpha-E superfamily protein
MALLGVMGVPKETGTVDVSRVLDTLAFDFSTPSSIVGSWTAAHENARGARDALSSEMWECLNATQNSLAAQVVNAAGAGPHVFFRHVRERATVMAGLADSTMSRDDGWRFLVLGRSLERLDMTTRLLLARFSQPVGPSEWITTLRCCSAHEAFLRTYRRAVEPALVAEFLVLDRLFPRSAFHALGVAELCLAELGPDIGRSGMNDEARRVLGAARAQLEFRHADDFLRDLPEQLQSLQNSCAEASHAVAERFFRQTAMVTWSPNLRPGEPLERIESDR